MDDVFNNLAIKWDETLLGGVRRDGEERRRRSGWGGGGDHEFFVPFGAAVVLYKSSD